MSDVARAAGVSSQTGSRTLSGRGAVSEATRQRVLDAARELGYHPDAHAQMLASGASRTVGVLMVGELSHGRMHSYVALERVEHLRGQFVISVTAEPDDPDSLDDALQYLDAANVKSIVLLGQRSDAVDRLLPHVSVPCVVVINTAVTSAPCSRVGIDQAGGVHATMDHLSAAGWRRPVAIVPAGYDVDARVREQAFREWCAGHGVPARVIEAPGWDCADGAAAASTLVSGLADGEGAAIDFDAVVAGNDSLAIGVAARLRDHGLAPGRDFALTGFDDIEVAAFQWPGLTSVRQDFGQLARVIADELDYLVAGGDPREQILPTHLVPRASSARPTP